MKSLPYRAFLYRRAAADMLSRERRRNIGLTGPLLWLPALLVGLVVIGCSLVSLAHAATPAALASEAVLTWIPSYAQLDPGEAISLTLQIQDTVDLAAFQFTVVYDPQRIHVVHVAPAQYLTTTGRAATPVGPVIDNTLGQTTFGVFTVGTNPGADGSGPLACVVVQAIHSGRANLRFSACTVTNSLGHETSLLLLSYVDIEIAEPTFPSATPTTVEPPQRLVFLPIALLP